MSRLSPQPARSTPSNVTPPLHGATGAAGRARRGGFAEGYVFGVPLGELGWFQTLLLSAATGFAAFFVATFLAIFGILFYNAATHRTVDFALSYRRIGFPIGVAVLVLAIVTLGSLWARRKLRKG